MARTVPFPFRDHHDHEVYGTAHNDLVDHLIRQYGVCQINGVWVRPDGRNRS